MGNRSTKVAPYPAGSAPRRSPRSQGCFRFFRKRSNKVLPLPVESDEGLDTGVRVGRPLSPAVTSSAANARSVQGGETNSAASIIPSPAAESTKPVENFQHSVPAKDEDTLARSKVMLQEEEEEEVEHDLMEPASSGLIGSKVDEGHDESTIDEEEDHAEVEAEDEGLGVDIEDDQDRVVEDVKSEVEVDEQEENENEEEEEEKVETDAEVDNGEEREDGMDQELEDGDVEEEKEEEEEDELPIALAGEGSIHEAQADDDAADDGLFYPETGSPAEDRPETAFSYRIKGSIESIDNLSLSSTSPIMFSIEYESDYEPGSSCSDVANDGPDDDDLHVSNDDVANHDDDDALDEDRSLFVDSDTDKGDSSGDDDGGRGVGIRRWIAGVEMETREMEEEGLGVNEEEAKDADEDDDEENGRCQSTISGERESEDALLRQDERMKMTGWMMGKGVLPGIKRSAADLADEIDFVVERERVAKHSFLRQAIRSSWMDRVGIDLDCMPEPEVDL